MSKTVLQYCGVPQCKTYREAGVSMHKIPKNVTNNKKEMLKWKIALKMGKPFPKNFVICSKHFRKNQILIPLLRNKRSKVKLLDSAFPTENLPLSSVVKKKCIKGIKERYERLKNRNSYQHCSKQQTSVEYEQCTNSFEGNIFHNSTNQALSQKSVSVQTCASKFDKGVQVIDELKHNSLPFKIDTDRKLSTMTGIPTHMLLEQIVQCCAIIRPSEKNNINMSLLDRIILTMYRIKNNASNALTAILFNISQKTARNYFRDCVQLLAKALSPAIYWQTKEENRQSLPACFYKFPNTITVLDCTEIRTIQFRCVTCRTSTYSHYKGTHTVKLLIGVSPSGLINFISHAVGGRTSDKAIFNLSNILEKLKAGDAVMVDKGFMIGNELSEAGIEMIRPKMLSIGREKSDADSDRLIAAARVHVERRISTIKIFKILSEKISYSNLPYIDDIMTVICAISNLSLPILNDNKF